MDGYTTMSEFTVHVTDDDSGTDYEYPARDEELAEYIKQVTESVGYTSEIIED